LIDEGRELLVSERSNSKSYFEERGYRPSSGHFLPGSILLVPPTRLPDVRAAGSICLLDSSGGSVLLGQRLTPPWLGYWAFPGGKLDAEESALDGALRELREETGIVAPARNFVLRTRVYAGGTDRVYAVDNFCIVVREQLTPQRSAELDARWFNPSEARILRPMAAGTRRVVRRVLARISGCAQ